MPYIQIEIKKNSPLVLMQLQAVPMWTQGEEKKTTTSRGRESDGARVSETGRSRPCSSSAPSLLLSSVGARTVCVVSAARGAAAPAPPPSPRHDTPTSNQVTTELKVRHSHSARRAALTTES